jgi:hypothetical protein
MRDDAEAGTHNGSPSAGDGSDYAGQDSYPYAGSTDTGAHHGVAEGKKPEARN